MGKKLHFVALVDLAAIPLYLLVKPHLDVWTHDEETELWLTHCLFRNLNDNQDADESSANLTSPWWSRPAQQSDHGILLEVRNGTPDPGSPGAVITEFLIYAAVLKSADSSSYLPSPPASSSPLRTNKSGEGSHGAPMQKIGIRAVPLTSTNHQLDYINHFNISPTDNHLNDGEACFLPTRPGTIAALPNATPKRQRLLHLFEDATYQRKRLSRRGGEVVSKAMAGLDSPVLHLESQRGSEPDKSNANGQVHVNTLRQIGGRRLSGSSSIPSIRHVEPSRLQSRPQQNLVAKQSSLSGVENGVSLGKAPTLPTDMNSFEDQNRSNLTRIIMAGMRIYGLQQRRKSVKLHAGYELRTDPSLTDMSISRGDDEYKMVYHQTLKAAIFAFRNQIHKEIINQAAMGDVVDQLLALFCTDPLAAQDTKNSFTSSSARNKGN